MGGEGGKRRRKRWMNNWLEEVKRDSKEVGARDWRQRGFETKESEIKKYNMVRMEW